MQRKPDVKRLMSVLVLILWAHGAFAESCSTGFLTDFVQRAEGLMLIRAGDRVRDPPEMWLSKKSRLNTYDFELIELFRGQARFDYVEDLHGVGFLASGRTYLISVTSKGGFLGCSMARAIEQPADDDPWVRVLRAHAEHRIRVVTNPWVFHDSGHSCHLQHNLDRGGAALFVRYVYADVSGSDTSSKGARRDRRAWRLQRIDGVQAQGRLEALIDLRVYYETLSSLAVEVGGDLILVRNAPLVGADTSKRFRILTERGAKRLLRALRYGDGSGLKVSWAHSVRDTGSGASSAGTDDLLPDVVKIHSETTEPFFDGALEEFRRCLRTKTMTAHE